MHIRIMPNFFLIRINKAKQKDFKEKIQGTSLYAPPSTVFESKNQEHGEILQVGGNADKIFEGQCRAGMILIIHWSVEASNSGKSFFMYEDENFNYYAVDENNVRGYYNGQTIIPHSKFAFFKQPEQKKVTQTISSGGIIMVENLEDKSSLKRRIEQNENMITSLSKATRTEEIQKELESLEREKNNLNRLSQKGEFVPMKIAYSHPNLDKDFGVELKENDIIYCLNKATQYISNYTPFGYNFIIVPVEYIGYKIND